MSTLYRDYRPNNFSEILGQNHIKITLQNEISSNNLSHAYLFCGPRAVGKTTTARILAKAVNCSNRQEKDFEPCDKCSSCLSIKKGSNLDVLEIDAASNTGVDNVRENIISFSRLAPSSSKFKVFIIDEVHMLSNQAFNALLKIMEEPPNYVIFILCTTEIQKVPGTIISRCERFDFKKISLSETIEKLSLISSQEKISVDREVLEAVAKRSGGYMRDAESLLGQVLSIGGDRIKKEQADLILPPSNDKEAISLIDCLLRKDSAKALSMINALVNSGVNVKSFNNDLINILRRLLMDKISPGLSDSLGLDLGESLEKEIIKLSELSKGDELIFLLKKFMETSSAPANQNIPQLPLEIVIAEICFSSNKTELPVREDYKKEELVDKKKENITTNNTSQVKEVVVESDNIKKEINKNISLKEISDRWPEFLLKIKNKNHSLSFVLQSCKPREVKDNTLCLCFKYKFHQNRVNEVDIKNIVKSVLLEVYGSELDFNTIIDENLIISENNDCHLDAEVQASTETKLDKEKTNSDTLGSLLNAFGGELVN